MPASSEATAEELAVRAQAGGADGLAAFSQLVEQYNGRLYSFLLRRLPPADAEDLVQEAFIRAWQRIGTYNPKYRFSTWLFTIATRLAISHLRSMRRSPSLEGSQQPMLRLEPGAAVSEREQSAQIWGLVEDILTVDQQTAMWLRYVEEMAIADVARVMGRTQVGVRVMLFRARNLLAERLERTEDGVRETGRSDETNKERGMNKARCAGGAA